MKSLPITVCAVLLLLAGCSYDPHVQKGEKEASRRTRTQVGRDILALLTELRAPFEEAKDAAAVRAALAKMPDQFNRLKELSIEAAIAKRKALASEDAEYTNGVGRNVDSAVDDTKRLLDPTQNPVRNLPQDVVASMNTRRQDLDTAMTPPAEALPAAPTLILASPPPESSTWMTGVLVLIVVAACLGFLFRDGMWSNAVRLVNVVVAGLLAMNFYEPLARYLCNYSADLNSFTAFWDFLSFWICFVGFASIFLAITDKVSRVRVRFLHVVERVGSPLLALIIGWVMAGIVLTSLHMAPLGEYPLLGCFQPQANMFFGMAAPDRGWLGFTQYQSENGFSRSDYPVRLTRFPDDFVMKHDVRRKEIEGYVRGNNDHAIKVNQQFATGAH